MGTGGTPPGVQGLTAEPHRFPLVKVAVILSTLIKLSQTGLKAASLWNTSKSSSVWGCGGSKQNLNKLQICKFLSVTHLDF